jgi:uncharacterized membrane protein YgcG
MALKTLLNLCQMMTTFQQPSLQHSTPTGCRLSGTVTVSPFPFQDTGLIRTFDKCNKSIQQFCPSTTTNTNRAILCIQQGSGDESSGRSSHGRRNGGRGGSGGRRGGGRGGSGGRRVGEGGHGSHKGDVPTDGDLA